MQDKSLFQEKRVHCHQSTAPYTTSLPEAPSPEYWVLYEPQDLPEEERVLPHHNWGYTH